MTQKTVSIQGVIFDLDGSLVDSMYMWKEIDVEFLGRFGLDVPKSLGTDIEGMSFTETAEYFKRTFSLPLSVEEIKDCWNQMAYQKYSKEVGFKPGAGTFLAWLKEKQIPTGIATSNSHTLVDAVLGHLGVAGQFRTIVTSCDVNRGKPEPDVYLCAARRMGINPAHCLVFEDVPAGILAGHRAGMHVIAVEDAFSADLAEKKRELADGMIETYEEVPRCENGEWVISFPIGTR